MVFVPLAAAVVFYLVAYGWRTLNPYYFNWLMDKDPANHFLGWVFYRQAPESFPWGQTPNLLTPIGSSVLNTDSNPLMAVLLKTVLGDGPVIQFTGAWLLACYLLQAWFAYRLLLLLTRDSAYSAVTSAFFIISPPLLFRHEHESLCAHWMILAALYLYFDAKAQRSIPYIRLAALNILSVTIHPYLFPMVLSLTLAIYGQAALSVGQSNKRFYFRSAFQLLGVALGALGSMYCFGYFTISSPGSWGFNTFSADLLTLFNSQRVATLLPYLRHSPSQHEGFAYLGAGLIGVFFYTIYLWRRRELTKLRNLLQGTLPLWVIAGLSFAFSLSGHITIAGNPILNLDWFYALFGPLTNIFRAPGRFVWPLYYLLLLALCLVPFCVFSRRRAFQIIGVVFTFQLLDLGAWISNQSKRAPAETNATRLLRSPEWERIASRGVQHLVLVPPALRGENFGCEPDAHDLDLVRALWLKAGLQHLTFNSGITSRLPRDRTLAHCAEFWEEIGRENRETAYVIPPGKYWERFLEASRSRRRSLNCEVVDGLHLCVAGIR